VGVDFVLERGVERGDPAREVRVRLLERALREDVGRVRDAVEVRAEERREPLVRLRRGGGGGGGGVGEVAR
jgi:hypothetical protein